MASKNSCRPKSAKQRFEERLIADKLKKEREKIVEFFLNLYNVQLRGADDAPRFFRQTSHRPDTGSTYELKVKHYGKWISRPMGIKPIGEEGGAKSRCFKVIYDEVLVVKIPLNPITDFEEYIEGIRNERKIADTLRPEIQCIAPATSPILKKIPAVSDGMYWSPEEIEEKSVTRLKQFPQLQDYLKIGDGFVYFMDISRHSFLLQVMDAILESKQKVKEEIVKQPDLISKFHKFEERYGIENTGVWLNMNRIYQDFQERSESIASQYGVSGMVHDYKRRKWFLDHLAENELFSDDPEISDEFFAELNKLLNRMERQYARDFRNYRRTVESFVQTEAFGRTKCQIAGIVTSILRLLADLREKKAAIRDLKPENIFVTGDSSKIALALARKQDVFLGLIDFETAVRTDCTKYRKLEQPLLGGTPSYATPSNFIPNDMINELFGDPARVLHLQDWQACICMIYSAVTGQTLFQTSKYSLFEIIRSMRDCPCDRETFLNHYRKNSFMFWTAARKEFEKKSGASKRLLDGVEVAVPSKAQKMFLEEALRSRDHVETKIRRTLKNQTLFRTRKNIETILNSSPEAIYRFRSKWRKGSGAAQAPPRDREKIVAFLKEIEDLKYQQRDRSEWIEIFSRRSVSVFAYDILRFMFDVVTQTLYRKQWGAPAVQRLDKVAAPSEKASL